MSHADVGIAVTTARRRAAAWRLGPALLSPRAARITAALSFLAAWQLIVPHLDTDLVPMPAEVAEEMVELAQSGDILGNFSVSLLRLGAGFAIGVLAGGAVGLLIGLSRRLEAYLHDFVVVGLTFPYLIWGILVSMWFGFGNFGPILVVVLAATPYAIINISEGVRDVPQELRDMAAAYEVPAWRAVRHVILPSLSPFFFATLRYGLANGWKGLVLAEVFAATSGAGWQIASHRDFGNSAGVVAYALYFAAFSIVVERLVFGRVSARVFRWRPSTVQRAEAVA